MKTLRLAATATTVGLLLALAPAASAAQAVHVNCGDVITVSTKIANDLTDCHGNGLIIGADNVTLDLNGHTIAGDATARPDCPVDEPCNVGVVNSEVVNGHAFNGPGYQGVTIKNGTISQFSEAGHYALLARDMRLADLTLAEGGVGFLWCSIANGRVERTTVQANGYGALFEECRGVPSHDLVIANNRIVDNPLASLFVGESHDVSVEQNTVIGAGGFAGVLILGQHNRVVSNQVSQNEIGILVDGGDAIEISDNHVFNNGDNISVFGSHNKVTDNRVADAVGCPDDKRCGAGISIDGGAGNLVARNDVVRSARDGLRVAAFDPSTPTRNTIVRSNRVVDSAHDGYSVATDGPGDVTGTLLQQNASLRSGDDGFDVRSAATTITSNDARRNADLGIAAVKGVTDGGGNTASNNGAPAQCRNVVCT